MISHHDLEEEWALGATPGNSDEKIDDKIGPWWTGELPTGYTTETAFGFS